MHKRGSLSSEILVYGVIVIIVSIVAVIGFNYISSQKNVDEDGAARAAINKNSNTVLKSPDGSALVIVPANAATSTKEISIKSVENPIIDSKKRASEIYQFGPSGTAFSNPVEIRIKYNPKIVGDCPGLINFYHYNEDGTVKEYVASKNIYCSSHMASFEIDSFSLGYAGLAIRDEETSEFNIISGAVVRDGEPECASDSDCGGGYRCTPNKICRQKPILCGNNNLDSGEECDGSNLNGKDCKSQGFDSGTLRCYPATNADNKCKFDSSGCTGGGGLAAAPPSISVAKGATTPPIAISGGTPPYKIKPNDPPYRATTNPGNDIALPSNSFTITGTVEGTTSIVIYDSGSSQKTVTIPVTVTAAGGSEETTPGSSCGQGPYFSKLEGFDHNKFMDCSHKTPKYLAARVFSNYASPQLTSEIISKLKDIGLNPTQVSNSKDVINFGGEVGKVDVIRAVDDNSGIGQAWQWLPVSRNEGAPGTPSPGEGGGTNNGDCNDQTGSLPQVDSLNPATISAGNSLTINGKFLTRTIQFYGDNGRNSYIGAVNSDCSRATINVPSDLPAGTYTLKIYKARDKISNGKTFTITGSGTGSGGGSGDGSGSGGGTTTPSSIWSPKLTNNGWFPQISPDGRYVTYGFGENWVVDLQTGEERSFTQESGQSFAGRWIKPDTLTFINYIPEAAERYEVKVGEWIARKTNDDPYLVAGNVFVASDGHWASFIADVRNNKFRIAYDNEVLATGVGGALSISEDWIVHASTNDNSEIQVWKSKQKYAVYPTKTPLHSMSVDRGYITYGGYGPVHGITPSGEDIDLTVATGGYEGVGGVVFVEGKPWVYTFSWDDTSNKGYILIRPWGERASIAVEAAAVSAHVVYINGEFIIAFNGDKGQLQVVKVPTNSPRVDLTTGIVSGGGSGGSGTQCGNGAKESEEECDEGSNNGNCPRACSSLCKINYCRPSAQASLQYFGYWPLDCLDRPSCRDDFTDHVNVIFGALETDFEYARTHGLKVVVTWSPFERTDAGDRYNPPERVLVSDYESKWIAYKTRIEPYIDMVASFMIVDEPNLHETDGPNPGASMSNQLEAVANMIKKDFPNVPVAIDLEPYAIDQYLGSTRIPSNVDWVGFDFDHKWTRCYSASGPCYSVNQYVDMLKARLASNQKIFMATDGVVIPGLSRNTKDVDEEDLLVRVNQNYDLAKSEPRIIAIFAYTWMTWQDPTYGTTYGVGDLPKVKAKYQEIGQKILNS